MLLGAESASTRYAGVFLGAMGIYPCISNTIAWASNNTEGKSCLLLFSASRRTRFTDSSQKESTNVALPLVSSSVGVISTASYPQTSTAVKMLPASILDTALLWPISCCSSLVVPSCRKFCCELKMGRGGGESAITGSRD